MGENSKQSATNQNIILININIRNLRVNGYSYPNYYPIRKKRDSATTGKGGYVALDP
jgi:hypothetical protein